MPPVDDGQNAPVQDEGGVLQPPVVANAPLQTESRWLRIGLSLGAGAATGAALAIVGAFAIPTAIGPVDRGWAGAGLGFAVGAPIGVLVTDLLMGGTGAWWACLVGDVVGFAAGAVATWLGGRESLPLLFAVPLAGAVVGYEVSAPVTPTVSVGNGGASFGVAGRF
jgi:hypothetical protein